MDSLKSSFVPEVHEVPKVAEIEKNVCLDM